MAWVSLKQWARSLKRDCLALWVAARDPRTPRLARWLAGFAAAYALSPIDLIPDAIPILGYLDDLVLVPLLMALAIRAIPPPLMTEFREQAEGLRRPVSRAGMLIILSLWGLTIGLLAYWLMPWGLALMRPRS